ncbi:hypothetical protein CYY_009771 [Polysphondylium violaceum]|uniref:Uncharacterized protein n=1 Tax=Polysphondylium violaceum TaxID=133409 RepID=A0A8J4UVQ5_9MYCE|nr:hypothetical protein CYY_009771 [Polysphondylium violaceum]
MKCLLIVDSIKDETLYSEHNVDTLGVNIKAIIQFIQMNIGERPYFFQAGKHRFVFQYNEHLWFILVSDDEDSEILLRHRLNLLNQLFVMILGSWLTEKNTTYFSSMYRLKKKMSQISATVNTMFDESQSVLAQAYESLEVNSGLRERCKNSLRDLLNSLTDSSYALMFVGTKLLAHNFKTKEKHVLIHSDIFLLSIYLQIQLHPRTIEKITKKNIDSPISQEINSFEQVPVSPIMESNNQDTNMNDINNSNSNNNNNNNINNSNNSIRINNSMERGINSSYQPIDENSAEEDNYETAPEDFDEPLYFLSSPFIDHLLEESNNNNCTTTTTANLSTSLPLPQQNNEKSSNINIGLSTSSGNVISPSPSSSSSSISSQYTAQSGTSRRNRHINLLIETLKEGLKSTSTGDAVSLINYSLYLIGYLDEYNQVTREIYTSTTEMAIKKFQEDNQLPANGAADFNIIKLILCKVRSTETIQKRRQDSLSNEDVTSFKDVSLMDDKSSSKYSLHNIIMNNQTNTTTAATTASTPTTSSTPATINNTPKQQSSNLLNTFDILDLNKSEYTQANSTYEKINLRFGNNNNNSYSPVWAFCSELQKNTFLIIINKDGGKDTAAEKKKLEESKALVYNSICKLYGDFLLTKEQSNIVISRFSHIPGLVHFLLIDRANHRIRAPSISPLFGSKFSGSGGDGSSPMLDSTNTRQNHNAMILFLKKKIWTMYSYCCQQLYRVNNNMIWNDKDFQYSYRLWAVDDENNEHKLDQQGYYRPNPKNFYNDLMKNTFPNSSKMKCYELLVLYIGILPTSMIAKNDKALFHLLFEIDE